MPSHNRPRRQTSQRKYTAADYRLMEKLRADGQTWNQIGIVFKVSGDTARTAFRFRKTNSKNTPDQTDPGLERDFKENKKTGEAVIEIITSEHVKTLADAVRVAEVDLSIWEVDTWQCRQWTTPLNIKSGQKVVKLKKVKSTGGGQSVECEEEALRWLPSQPMQQQQYLVAMKLRRKTPERLALETLLEEISQHQRILLPAFKKPKLAKQTPRRALEICVMDVHLGMRCYKPAADNSWSIDEAKDAFMATVEELLGRSRHFGPFEEVVAVIGNDYLHADHVFHTTTAGTPQPEMEAIHHVFVEGQRLMMWYIERLRSVGVHIKVVSIPGNHDRFTSFTMARIIQAYYEGADAKDVSVEADASPYKFWKYGVNLIGFEHGHSVKPVRMAALMANETRLKGWQDARYCEWHVGDQHRKGSSKPMMLEEQGVSVEYLPALTPPNEWHRLKSYNWQKRGAMAFIYDHSQGPIARLQVNFDSYTGYLMGRKIVV